MIAIFGKTLNQSNSVHAQELFDYLAQKKMKYVVEKNFLQLMKNDFGLKVNDDAFEKFDEIKNSTEVVFSMGGDGTILDAVVMIKESQIPILGINFGRLGFLASLGKDPIKADDCRKKSGQSA